MQPGGGGGRRPVGQARGRRVDRLVAVRVVEGAAGCRAAAAWCPARSTTDGSSRRTRRGRPSGSASTGSARPRRPARPVDPVSNSGVPGGQPPPRTDQRLPLGGPPSPSAAGLEQQHLGPPAGGLDQVQPGRQHPGVVDHQHVAGPQQPGQVGHGGVPGAAAVAGRARGRPAAGRAPGLDRRLGDGRFGEAVVVGVHRDAGPGARTVARRHRLRQISADMATMVAERRGHGAATQSRVGSTGVRPRWAQARGAAIRPRVVRWSRPCWSR